MVGKATVCLLALCGLMFASVFAQTSMYTIRAKQANLVDWLKSEGADWKAHGEHFRVWAQPEEAERVLRSLHARELLEILEIEQGVPFFSKVDSVPRSTANCSDGSSHYHDPKSLMEQFECIHRTHPSLTMLIDLTSAYQQPSTWEDRHIFALKISDQAQHDEDEPNLLVVSNHHARELVTPEIALDTARRLTDGYATNATLKKIVDDNQVYIVWTMNPDGLNYVWTKDNMWRKNRRPDGDRVYGVDLNRNYPFGWNFTCGGSSVKSSETYKGPTPASEPETETMIAFQHHRKFAKVLDFHSYAREVRPNYAACASMPAQENAMLIDIGNQVATAMGYTRTQSCCLGGDVAFAFHDIGSLATLVETARAFQPPAADMEAELERVWPGTLLYLQTPIPLQGHTYNTHNNQPMVAKFDILGLNFNYREVWSSAHNGRYSLWIPAGNWTVVAYAPAFANATSTVTIVDGQSVSRDFYMTPQQ